MYHQQQPQHYLHGQQPYTDDSSYDEEDDSSSSQCSGEDCSDESSLTDYHPSDKVRNYFSNQTEMQHYYNALPKNYGAQPQYVPQPGFHSKANYHRVITSDEPQILSQKRNADQKYYPAPKAAGQESSPDQLSSNSSANDNVEPLQPLRK